MGLNHSNSEWYNPNVMFVFLRIAWARLPVNRKEIVLTAVCFYLFFWAESMFKFFKKWEYPKGGGGCTSVNSWWGCAAYFSQSWPYFWTPLPPTNLRKIIILLSSQITTPQLLKTNYFLKRVLTHKIPVGSIVNRVPIPWDIRPPVCPTFMMFTGQNYIPT